MNDANTKIKQQIVEKIKSSTNILVTVSKDPSVDDLSAAIGLTILLNKLDKHTTAIFSGAIPPAITFLEPDKIFEGTADSLRDFIIALDKEKADHLRYKIEGDVVKIFITPYRTTITSDDLEFSQGDFNVELVLALGVDNQEHLDVALSAHGQILHDVTIATFSAGTDASQLGSMDWRDETASSLCEMVTSISESLKTDKPLLDKQISTALLTGIVYATDRFSNQLTTSRVMTMAAQLMAAGADQQLVAAKLQESHEITTLINTSIKDSPETDQAMEIPVETDKPADSTEPAAEPAADVPGMLSIEHEPEVLTSTLPPEPESLTPAEPELPTIIPEPAVTETPFTVESSIPGVSFEPSLGGTLNATTDQAAEDTRRELEDTKNKTILTHSYLTGSEPSSNVPINSVGQVENTENVDIFANAPMISKDKPMEEQNYVVEPKAAEIVPPPTEIQTWANEQSASERDNDEAMTAVTSALGPQPVVAPPALDLPMPPELPDFSTLPPPTSFAPETPTVASTPTPLSNPFSTLPPEEDNPSQFKIPGQ